MHTHTNAYTRHLTLPLFFTCLPILSVYILFYCVAFLFKYDERNHQTNRRQECAQFLIFPTYIFTLELFAYKKPILNALHSAV